MKWAPIAIFCLLAMPASAQQEPIQNTAPTPPEPDIVDILNTAADQRSSPPPVKPGIKIPNFTSCPVPELKKAIPDLAHLKPSQDQSHLIPLLDKIGATTIDIARRTPDLISHEQIVSEHAGIRTSQNFSFLILQRVTKLNSIVLDEFRVDTRTGEKFETEQNIAQAKAPGSEPSALQLPSSSSIVGAGAAPATQGFFSQWLSFYPMNRGQADFRYLGEEKLKGHETLVVAFAQKPGFVPIPAAVEYGQKLHKFFLQGVAWVDATDFRILRLWTGILAPPPGVPLRHLNTDVHFAEAQIAEISSPLWLPKEVVVDWNIGGFNVRNTHTYSKYRLFRAKSKLVLNP